ncbi:MAG: ATP-binding protein [Anaerolineae bacterium]|nr:ATP-binding protein [Anaerolineae bacterium]
MINKLLFENVRCFYGEHTSLLKPLTFLLGENSSGKTSFLALNRIAWDIAQGDLSDDIFNEDPFLLGAYDQIASYKGGKAGRSKTFTIGCEVSLTSKTKRPEIFSDAVVIKAQFTSHSGQPKLDKWIFGSGRFGLELRFGDQKQSDRSKNIKSIK